MAAFISTASAISPTAPLARKKRERYSRKKRRPEKRRQRPKRPRSPVRRSQTRRNRKTNPNHHKPASMTEVRGEASLFAACHRLPPLLPLPSPLLSSNERAGEAAHLRHHTRKNFHALRWRY